VASMLLHLEVDDFDAWKPAFDADPAGRRQVATGHMMFRPVDDPKGVFIRADFSSVEQAKAFREKLIASGALDRPDTKVKIGPTVVEQVEAITY
jgi:hypothetical protein